MRLLAGLALAFSAVATQATDCEQGAELLNQAQKAYADVVEVGFAWKTTEDYLQDAQKAEMDGDCAALNAHALRALNTAKAAMEQSRVEQDAWRNRVPKG